MSRSKKLIAVKPSQVTSVDDITSVIMATKHPA